MDKTGVIYILTNPSFTEYIKRFDTGEFYETHCFN